MMKKILLILALLIVILLVAPFFIPSDTIRQAIEEQATEAAGMPVRLKSVKFRLLPLPGISIEGLQLEDVKGGTPKLSVISGSLKLALIPLLTGQAEISGIIFEDITLRTSDEATGKEIYTIHIDKITGKVKLTADALTLPDWNIHLYDGLIKFDGALQPLSGKDSTFEGKIIADTIQIQALLKDAAGQNKLAGTFSSELILFAKGEDGTAMERSLKVDGPVRLESGTMKDIRLEGIAGMLVPAASKGLIVYDRIQTTLAMRGKEIQANEIDIDATGFKATGNVTIKADSKMNGKLEVSTLGGITGVKLLIGGSTESPRIYPAPSSIVGGVLGSTIGGPAGAAMGAKLGGKAGNIVGGAGKTLKGILGK